MVMKFSGRFLFRFEIMLFFLHKKIVSKLTLIDLLDIKLFTRKIPDHQNWKRAFGYYCRKKTFVTLNILKKTLERIPWKILSFDSNILSSITLNLWKFFTLCVFNFNILDLWILEFQNLTKLKDYSLNKLKLNNSKT